MVQLILMIVGIFYAIRRPRITHLTAKQFPALSPDTFNKLQVLILKSIDMLLWASWGVFIIGLLVEIVIDASGIGRDSGTFWIFQILDLASFLILWVFSMKSARQAERLILQTTSSDYFDVAELLLDRKTNFDIKDKNGYTRLHNAVIKNQKDVATLLLVNGANANAKDNDGETPLHYAAFKGNKELIELLLASGADVNAKDNDGETPLRMATVERQEDVRALLLQHGGQE